MNIGVFDSGLGGLWMLKHLRTVMPEYDYVFFGDQANVPYGNKTKEELLTLTKSALKFFYEEHDCLAVLLACNTTSSTIHEELREWVKVNYPGRFVFGIVKPTVEAVPHGTSVNVFATQRTIDSHTYNSKLEGHAVNEMALPELATIIEDGGDALKYLESFSKSIPRADVGLLVCTHYGIIREDFIKAFPNISTWLSQEEIIPKFFKSFIDQKEDFRGKLSTGGTMEIYVSKESNVFNKFTKEWFGNEVKINTV